MTSALEIALSLAQGPNQYKVFPCAADKRPLTKNGFKDASNDPEKIYLMPWARAGLVGIACAPSGVLAVDIDNKDGRNGSRGWQNLLSAYGAAVDAGPMQRTPSGGYHLVFAHPPVEISQSHDTLADGIDIRSSGYICTGAGYEWLEGRGPHCELLDAPAFLLMLLAPEPEPETVTTTAARPSHYTTNTDKWLNDALSMARIGNRNQTGFWLACQLRDDGITQSEACALSYPEGVPQKNGNKYTRRDWTKTVQSAYSKTPREPARSLSSSLTPGPSPAAGPTRPLGEGGGPQEPEPPPNFSPETPTGEKLGQYSTWADLESVLGPIEFDWEGWIARGFLSLFVSESGTGKSQFLLRVAGSYILGIDFPDGTPFMGETGKVLWCEAEAAQALNLERARNWGYPLDGFISPLGDPTQDVNLDDQEHRRLIEMRAKLPEVKLIIIDSLSGSSNANENETKIKDVTGFCARLARDTGKPVLMSHHLNKKNFLDGDQITLARVRGSSAIQQHARIICALSVPNAEHPESVKLEQIKNNLARWPVPIGMTITERGLTFGEAPQAPKVETMVDKAVDLLHVLLGRGPEKATVIQTEFTAAAISWRTANEAKKRMRIVSYKNGADRCWYWSLPAGGEDD